MQAPSYASPPGSPPAYGSPPGYQQAPPGYQPPGSPVVAGSPLRTSAGPIPPASPGLRTSAEFGAPPSGSGDIMAPTPGSPSAQRASEIRTSVDPEEVGFTLCDACGVGYSLSRVSLFLHYPFQWSWGLNVNAKDNALWTPLHLAVAYGHENCVRELLMCPYLELDHQGALCECVCLTKITHLTLAYLFSVCGISFGELFAGSVYLAHRSRNSPPQSSSTRPRHFTSHSLASRWPSSS